MTSENSHEAVIESLLTQAGASRRRGDWHAVRRFARAVLQFDEDNEAARALLAEATASLTVTPLGNDDPTVQLADRPPATPVTPPGRTSTPRRGESPLPPRPTAGRRTPPPAKQATPRFRPILRKVGARLPLAGGAVALLLIGWAGGSFFPLPGTAETEAPAPTANQRAQAAETVTPQPSPSATATATTSATTTGKTYTVKKGDTCLTIAGSVGATFPGLLAENPEITNDCKNLQENQKLRVPDAKTYTVKAGEFCQYIAADNKLTIGELRFANQDTVDAECNDLKQGQVIRIPRAVGTLYTLKTEDQGQCARLAEQFKVTIDWLRSANPDINTDCTNLMPTRTLRVP